MKVIMMGTGNVAVVLSQLLVAAGHFIVEVHGRNPVGLNYISQLTGAESKTNFLLAGCTADICILAVSDSAISQIANQLESTKMLVVHTSGTTSKTILNRFKNYGVLYPLQSLRKEMKQLPDIPFFVDANTEKNLTIINELASSTGNKVAFASDEERLKLHIAAVLCSNFTNHLYALTQSYCEDEHISFENLLPLIKETANRLDFFPAAQLQTGPAIRHDEHTIHRHLEVLQTHPHIKQIYQMLTESIQRFAKL